MKKVLYITLGFIGILMAGISFTACEFDEPFPTPSADFTVWGINPATNAYEQIAEPLVLYSTISYDFVVEGSGQQFVFWFGIAGDTTKTTPTGSDFNDRGLNHLSKGKVALNKKTKFSYSDSGTYQVVLVASSYSYTEDKFLESLTEKTVEVMPTAK
jgi:hypothetical protein